MSAKKVIKYENQVKVSEKETICHPLRLAPASKLVVPIYYDCLKEIFEYEKKPSLFSQHLLFLDDRLFRGYKIYKEKKICELTKTQSDIRATVRSVSDPSKTHNVIIKGWLPLDGIPRRRYEIIKYLEELTVSCDCEDFVINGKYRSNTSIICHHIAAVFWFLMQEGEMPKFLLTPEERGRWYEKAKPEELLTHIDCLPMKRFSQFLNVLLLRDYKGIPTSFSYSIHRVPNIEYEKEYPNGIPPVWATITEPDDVAKVIKASIKGYAEMLASRNVSTAGIMASIQSLVPGHSNAYRYYAERLRIVRHKHGRKSTTYRGLIGAVKRSKKLNNKEKKDLIGEV